MQTTVDTDTVILKLLTIGDLYQICSVNKYIYNICVKDDTLVLKLKAYIAATNLINNLNKDMFDYIDPIVIELPEFKEFVSLYSQLLPTELVDYLKENIDYNLVFYSMTGNYYIAFSVVDDFGDDRGGLVEIQQQDMINIVATYMYHYNNFNITTFA